MVKPAKTIVHGSCSRSLADTPYLGFVVDLTIYRYGALPLLFIITTAVLFLHATVARRRQEVALS